MDYRTQESLRRTHPAWRLLVADHAPLIASFLHLSFILPNTRSWPRLELASRLEDQPDERRTLLAHREPRVREHEPFDSLLSRLDSSENASFADPDGGGPRDRMRLEQRRIPFGRFRQTLEALPVPK